MILFKFQNIRYLRTFVLTLAIILLFAVPRAAARKRQTAYRVTAKSAILVDISSGRHFYGKNIHARVLPASTAKVMTALLVLERLSLNKVVRMSEHAVSAQPSKLGARVNERFQVEELLYAILLQSANDASIALAEAISGSEWEFVKLMNQRARALGAKHTHFVNSSGLPTNGGQYTTAYDMSLMFRAALKYDLFRAAIRYPYKSISSLDGRRFDLKNHNKILFMNWRSKLYGKTGYTRGAKCCFVGYLTRGRDAFIIAVFGCQKRWTDIKYIVSRYGRIPL